MKDSLIVGSGNSRYLKSVENFKTLYPTYDDFAAALVAGTLPIDLNGINSGGFQQLGDPLNKNTLLKDATAQLLSGDDTMLPDDAIVALYNLILQKYNDATGIANQRATCTSGSYSGTGLGNRKRTLNFGFYARLVVILSSEGFRISGQPIRTAVLVRGVTQSDIFPGRQLSVSWGTNSVSFSSSTSESGGLDDSGYTYYWVAVG